MRLVFCDRIVKIYYNNPMKLPATIVGPYKLEGYGKYLFPIKASKPFGGIEISEYEIVISTFLFKTKIDKVNIISIKKREENKGIEIIYLKREVKMRVLCSVKDNNQLINSLINFGYSIEQ